AGDLLNDTWLYDGTSWRVVPTSVSPPPMESAQLIYDARRKVSVLVGGIVKAGLHPLGPPTTSEERLQIWEFDGQGWAERVRSDALAPSLKTRNSVAAFWNPVSETVMLF